MTAVGAGAVQGATAPSAPGRLGSPLDPTTAQVYLDALGRWRDDRHRELEQLDKAALGSPEAASLTGDIMLSMALWKAASDRYDLLVATWDGGRVGVSERERMSSLIWGRLDATLDPSILARSSAPASMSGSGLTVSLPEACRLSDALASQLRVRLALDPSGLEVAERLRQLRAQMERIRDQVDLEPAGTGQQAAARQQAGFGRRLKEIADKAGRGGDVGGLLAPLELEASRFERDLIVNGAVRRQSSAKVEQARALRTDLKTRAGALQKLVDTCVAAVEPSPNYAVPDIDALGPVPNTAAALDAYLHRLQQVSRAMTHAQDAYTQALKARDDLLSLLDAYRAKAQAVGLHRDADLALVEDLLQRTFARQPVRMVVATQVVELYQTYVQAAAPTRPSTPRGPRRPASESR
ncbi:MAG: hypothetical protein ABWX96_21045 [Propionibacteriaceae bacterium]